jgi:hypothetical protein
MEQPDAVLEFQGAGNGKLGTIHDPLLEVYLVLAHDIVHNLCNWNVFHVE